MTQTGHTNRRKIMTTQLVFENGATNEPLELMREFSTRLEVTQTATLLAHLYDGVLWASARAGSFTFASGLTTYVPPVLSSQSILEARLFTHNTELHLWRDNSQLADFCWRTVSESHKDRSDQNSYEVEFFSEDYLLWGTHAEEIGNGFVVLKHGCEGLRHAIPLNPEQQLTAGELIAPPRLRVQHYLTANGTTRVAFSKCVQLMPLEKAR